MCANQHHGCKKRGIQQEKYHLPGSLTGLFRIFTSDGMSCHHGTACSQCRENINDQNIDIVHQRNAGNRSFAYAGNHDSIQHTD